MIDIHQKETIQDWDERKKIIILPSVNEAVEFAATHFITTAKKAIEKKGKFTVALSGGSTPKKIYQRLNKNYHSSIDWTKVFLFFGDERAVPLDHPQSNYHMAMEAGFSSLPIPDGQIFPMPFHEENYPDGAEEYEKILDQYLDDNLFDLVMLGVGEDGHTASLFPNTKGLEVQKRAVCANFVPQKASWRMTLTFDCINNSSNICFYAFGEGKKEILKKIFLPSSKSPILPAEQIGTPESPALWVVDEEAAKELLESIS